MTDVLNYNKLNEFLEKYPRPHLLLDNDWIGFYSSEEFYESTIYEESSIPEGESISFYATPEQILGYLIENVLDWSAEYV
jgi:hypothetical protein